MSHGTRSALLLGATGLVGGHCLDLLLTDDVYGRVVTLGRRPVPREHPRLEQRIVDFERLEEEDEDEEGAGSSPRDVFCCLGTTIGKAGSREAFRRVDFEYPYSVAQRAVREGAEQFLLVSASSARPGSRVFYSRAKGELEEAVSRLPFRSVVILRPSLLLGDREEFRLGERLAEPVMKGLAPLLVGPLRKYRALPARAVAAAMVRLAKEAQAGVRVIESDAIQDLAGARG